MVIYKITNKINGKIYIGQTNNSLEYRWKQHCAPYSKTNSYLYNSVKCHGKEVFETKIIARCNNQEEMDHRETYYIRLFNTLVPNGYNLRSGGSRGRMHEESKKLLSKVKKGKHYSPSTEFKKGQPSLRVGTKHTEETKRKMRKPRSEQAKVNMSLARKAKPLSEKQLKVCLESALKNCRKVINLDTGEIFESIKDAAKKYSFKSSSGISAVARNKRKSCGGFRWSYL